MNEFTKVLPTALAHTVEIAPSVKPKLIRILDIWSEREVIIRSEVDRLRSFVIHGTDPKRVNPVSSVRIIVTTLFVEMFRDCSTVVVCRLMPSGIDRPSLREGGRLPVWPALQPCCSYVVFTSGWC